MKILKTIQWSLRLLGYDRFDRRKFSRVQVGLALGNSLVISLACAYPFSEVDTIEEYLYSIYEILVFVFAFLSFVDTARKTEIIFLMIDISQKFIQQRKYLVWSPSFGQPFSKPLRLIACLRAVQIIHQYSVYFFNRIGKPSYASFLREMQ